MDELSRSWRGVSEAANVQRTILHYRDGKIDIDLYFPLSCYLGAQELDDLRSRLQDRLGQKRHFRELNIYFG